MAETIETAPVLGVTAPELESVLDELRAYHAIYSPLYQRREQREWAETYLQGLLSDLARKSIEPMVLELKGADPNAVRAMQQFISEGAWKDEAILKRHWQEVEQTVGAEDGVLIVDGSDFLKQGQESVGVKRQSCGEVGTRATCQAGVFLGYASARGYTLLDRRLYMPQDWLEDEAYAARRQRYGVPEDLAFKTKPSLALEMIRAVQQTGRLRFQWLTCDEGFGRSGDFLDALADLGIWYYAEVPHDTRVWLTRPRTAIPEWSGSGRKPTRAQLLAGEPAPQAVADLAATLAAEAWSPQTIMEGSHGPLVAEFAVLRVVSVRDDLPAAEVWLVLRRNPLTGELKTYLSNAPAPTPRATLVRLSGLRWPIERCFEDSKQLVGMGDDEVRTWRGWHHHMTLVILAHFFLVRQQLRLKKTCLA